MPCAPSAGKAESLLPFLCKQGRARPKSGGIHIPGPCCVGALGWPVGVHPRYQPQQTHGAQGWVPGQGGFISKHLVMVERDRRHEFYFWIFHELGDFGQVIASPWKCSASIKGYLLAPTLLYDWMFVLSPAVLYFPKSVVFLPKSVHAANIGITWCLVHSEIWLLKNEFADSMKTK